MTPASIIEAFEKLPKLAKVLILIIGGWIIGGIYRILRYCDTKNTVTLIAGIVGLIPGVDFVVEVVDIVCEILHNKLTILVD